MWGEGERGMEWTVLSCVKKETFPSPPLSDTICPAAPSIWMKGGIPCKPPSPGSCGWKTPWRNMKRRCCACAARCWATPRWRRTPCRIPSSAHGARCRTFAATAARKPGSPISPSTSAAICSARAGFATRIAASPSIPCPSPPPPAPRSRTRLPAPCSACPCPAGRLCCCAITSR